MGCGELYRARGGGGGGGTPDNWKGGTLLYYTQYILLGEGLISEKLCGIRMSLGSVADCIAANSVSWLLLVETEGRV
jgi:hypothetical protein